MGKVYIGVMVVGGHKLWGGGWREGCGIRWFGEWVGGGRLTAGGGEVAGRACPAPTGVMVEGTVCFPHSAHVNVENTCNFYLIIIV